ncbi:MAG: hypothetical protein K6F82_06790 [Sphaerochaetaceae bacterium]|nr:hypothetical protein [Sphaerochaetaceae bacterium]
MSIPQIIRDEKDLKNWNERREEILSLIRAEMFGTTPAMSFDSESCVCLEHLKFENNMERYLYGLCLTKGSDFCGLKFTVTCFENKKDKPIVLYINPFSHNPKVYSNTVFSFKDYDKGGVFPEFRLVNEGFVAVNCFVDELSSDSPMHTTHDLLQLYPPGAWCTIGAWAWGADKTASLLPSLGFTSKKITVCGFSRGAKTALWAGAQYERFTSVYACNPGCCGAAIFRGKQGEMIKDITERYPYWSCDNFKKYSGKEEELPFDQHMLLSLIFPRPLYISSAIEDKWSDPEKEFEGVSLVSAFHEKMGYRGLGTDVFPPLGKTIRGDILGYHVREGDHDCNSFDWSCVIEFLKGIEE